MNASLRRPLGVVLNRARPRVGEQRQLISACSIETRRLSITCLDALKGTGRNHLRNSLAFSFEQKNIVLPWATQLAREVPEGFPTYPLFRKCGLSSKFGTLLENLNPRPSAYIVMFTRSPVG